MHRLYCCSDALRALASLCVCGPVCLHGKTWMPSVMLRAYQTLIYTSPLSKKLIHVRVPLFEDFFHHSIYILQRGLARPKFFLPGDGVIALEDSLALLSLLLLLLLLLFLIFSVLVANPKKTTLHGGQSHSWSAEHGKENKIKSLAAYPPPYPPHTARSEKINKITRRIIYRRYAGLGRSRVRTRIPSARRLGQWVWLREFLHFRLR